MFITVKNATKIIRYNFVVKNTSGKNSICFWNYNKQQGRTNFLCTYDFIYGHNYFKNKKIIDGDFIHCCSSQSFETLYTNFNLVVFFFLTW